MYSLDTSILIHAYRSQYPPDVAPRFWEIVEAAIAEGELRASEAVLHELEWKEDEEDWLLLWARRNRDLFIPVDEAIQTEVRALMARFPRLVNVKKNKSGGDPFVIALAKLNGWTVVTQETLVRPAGPGLINLKIPNVCLDLAIPYVDLNGLFRAEGWRLA